ncbi:methyl-accepting chemotaxis protein [Phototrophicus methaneseepsis]|uniref:Methyl-accepting chemotaxis protein n=1 Tax=Phototrophicus methaneseepsis TaxID=2710758 RepID=A0A7S8IGZ9_9CHLR|nr:methyl-accepting chemotaxis protein [Phototrophicus methaneseepsis]QPC84673.1 methyl-accepting chemotaxis protein [Phototrophicus methaneseepsis]
MSDVDMTLNQAYPTRQAPTSLSRLNNRVVIYTMIAALIPSAIMSLILLASGFTDAWVVAAPLISLVFGLIVGLLVYRYSYERIDETVRAYADVLDKVAEGDLHQRLTPPQIDASYPEGAMLHHLASTVNRTLDTIQTIVRDFDAAMQRLEADTQAILEATSRQITMANEQDAVVTETTATVNEVRATVTETAERAQSVAETAQHSVDISREGLDAVRETIDGMEMIRRRVEDIADNILVLSEHTQQIGEIIAAVNNLADQSRMLALNASVEAARAGEEGKGFAVVAMEVRNLADQNRDATVQVREILGEIQRSTNSAVMVTEEGSKGVDSGQQQANRAGGSINELARAIEEAATAAMQIAASTRQQTIGMDQLTGAMATIKRATTETVSSTMQVEASVQRLRDAARRVNEVLGGLQFKHTDNQGD